MELNALNIVLFSLNHKGFFGIGSMACRTGVTEGENGNMRFREKAEGLA